MLRNRDTQVGKKRKLTTFRVFHGITKGNAGSSSKNTQIERQEISYSSFFICRGVIAENGKLKVILKIYADYLQTPALMEAM